MVVLFPSSSSLPLLVSSPNFLLSNTYSKRETESDLTPVELASNRSTILLPLIPNLPSLLTILPFLSHSGHIVVSLSPKNTPTHTHTHKISRFSSFFLPAGANTVFFLFLFFYLFFFHHPPTVIYQVRSISKTQRTNRETDIYKWKYQKNGRKNSYLYLKKREKLLLDF